VNDPKQPHEQREHLGKYRGFVRDVNDPEQLGRVKCQVPAVLGNEVLTDWSWPAGAWYGGGEDYGRFEVPPLGSAVLVEFEDGNVDRPLYTAVWWGKPGGKNHAPKLARGVKDETAGAPKGTDQFAAADGSVHVQPSSPYAAKYPFNLVLKTKESKHVIEVDDTPGNARLHRMHGPSKSFEEIGPTGETSVRVAARRYTEVVGADETHVKQDRHAAVVGNDSLQVFGNQTVRIFGNRRTFVFGDDTEMVIGSKLTTVMLQYARIAGVVISDRAAIVTHNP